MPNERKGPRPHRKDDRPAMRKRPDPSGGSNGRGADGDVRRGRRDAGRRTPWGDRDKGGRHGHGDRSDGGRGEARDPARPTVHLSDDIVAELRATARPGKGDILVKVFADAAAAFLDEDYDEAIRLGEQAKHIALRSIAAREFLGLAYYKVGKWNEAARELAAFKRLSGSKEQNPVLADCYRALGKPDKALSLTDELGFREVSQPVYYEGAIVAAGALADQGHIDAAIARLESLDLDPETAEDHHLRAWYVLADLLERKGRFTQARERFEAIAAANPDLTDAPERAAHLTAR